jgi:hypothetical protein
MRTPTTRFFSVLAVVLLVLAVGACSMGGGEGSADAPSRPATTVEVQNNNWMDMVIYVVRSGMRVRLGMVTTMNRASFRVPNFVAGASTSVRLEAHPIGSNQRFVAPAVQAWPGQTIDLTIQNHLAVSSVTVW